MSKFARQPTWHLPLLAVLSAATLLFAGCGTGIGASASNPTSASQSSMTSPTPTAEPTIAGGVPTTAVASPAPEVDSNTSPGHCDGTIAAVAVDDVDVPSGATCTLDGTTVNGNVSIGPDGTLVARGVAVDGDVEAERARAVEITSGSSIGGNVQLQEGGSATLSGTDVDGDVEWEGQRGDLTAEGNTIGGDVQADSNTGTLTVSGNQIDGDLQCDENNPAPTGGGNTVSGDREDQCSGL